MCRIDLLDLLAAIEDYVLLKKSHEFPRYLPGDDVDLLVMDRERALRAIRSYYETVQNENAELRVSDTPSHCHVDFVFAGELDIRIDLLEDFAFFTSLEVKPSFVIKVFRDSQLWQSDGGRCQIPAPEDDLTIRYLEYLEYFAQRPDKVKHLDYICNVPDASLKQRFFENTHLFIRFRRATWTASASAAPPRPRSRRQALENVLENLRYLVSATGWSWARKAARLLGMGRPLR